MNIKKAAMINMMFKYSTVFIQLLINSILARIISPDEFGIIAILTVFINFFSILSDMGIGSAVIQYKQLNNRDYSNIYSFTVYLAALLSIIFCGLSFVIAWIYEDSVYVFLCMILSLSIFFNTLNMVPNALLLKQQKFKQIGIRTFTITFLCGVITIAFAYIGFSYYALVLNSVLTAFLIYVWNKNSVKLTFKLRIEWESIRLIRKFSTYQFCFGLINYFSRNLDNLLIGLKMSKIELGYYDRAYKLMTYPITMLPSVINPVLHPILSNYQNNVSYISKQYIKLINILSFISIPVTVLCVFASSEIVTILYGNQWDRAVPIFQALSLSIYFQINNSITGSIYQSLGKTNLLMKTGIINTIISIIAIIIGIITGNTIMLGVLVSIAYILHFFITNYILFRFGFRLRYQNFITEIYKNLLILFLLFAFTFIIPFGSKNVFISVVLKSFWVIAIYGILLLVSGNYKKIINSWR